MIAAASDFAGTRKFLLSRPAKPAARNAPIMMPKFITDVTSVNTLAFNEAALAASVQYGQAATFTPKRPRTLAPHRANAPVIPHGRPDMASARKFTRAKPTAPHSMGHGPRRIEPAGASASNRP